MIRQVVTSFELQRPTTSVTFEVVANPDSCAVHAGSVKRRGVTTDGNSRPLEVAEVASTSASKPSGQLASVNPT